MRFRVWTQLSWPSERLTACIARRQSPPTCHSTRPRLPRQRTCFTRPGAFADDHVPTLLRLYTTELNPRNDISLIIECTNKLVVYWQLLGHKMLRKKTYIWIEILMLSNTFIVWLFYLAFYCCVVLYCFWANKMYIKISIHHNSIATINQNK